MSRDQELSDKVSELLATRPTLAGVANDDAVLERHGLVIQAIAISPLNVNNEVGEEVSQHGAEEDRGTWPELERG